MPKIDLGYVIGPKGNDGDIGPQGPKGDPATVNGVSPDEQGNIILTAEQVGAVSFIEPQTLTEESKAQARENIESVSETELLDLKMLGWTVPHDFAVQNFGDSNGIYHQRVGRVDLGDLTYSMDNVIRFRTPLANMKIVAHDVAFNGYCKLFISTPYNGTWASGYMSQDDSNRIVLIASGYANSTEFKTAMSGVYLYYELETEITRPIDGGEWAVRYSNPNLLDNPFFQIHQRGITSGSGDGSYVADRWLVTYGSGGVTWNRNADGSVTFKSTTGASYADLFQRIAPTDAEYLNGKTVTVSYRLGDDSILSVATVYDSVTSTKTIYNTDNIRIRITNSGDTHAIGISGMNGKTLTVKAVKLELGSVSTLANDSAPDYATELLKCQRYFRSLTYGKTGLVYLSNAMCSYGTVAHAILPIEMRAKPTVTVIGNIADFNVYTSSGHAATAVSVGGINIGFGIDLTFNVSGGLTAGQAALIFLDSGKTSDIWLSADL